MMAKAWTTASVADCLVPVPISGKTTIPKSDYKPAGRFPIIDQSQQQIAGWTDDERAVIHAPLPLIVFGDHTRALKFVDVSFARGADGTQLLRPRQDIDPLFFFYACRAIDLPARGYNRHFTILKEQQLSFPMHRVEQVAIAGVLRLIDTAIEMHRKKGATLEELFRVLLHNLMTGELGLDDLDLAAIDGANLDVSEATE